MNSEEHTFKVEANMSLKEMVTPDAVNSRKLAAEQLRGSNLMSDYDILTKEFGYDNDEAEAMISRMKLQKLEEAKLQILMQNPQLGIQPSPQPMPEDKMEMTQMMALTPMALSYTHGSGKGTVLVYLDFYSEKVYDANMTPLENTMWSSLNDGIVETIRSKKGSMMPALPQSVIDRAYANKNKVFEGMKDARENKF